MFAVRSGLGAAVAGLMNLAGEGVGHLGALGGFRFMVPQLLLVGAGHLGHYELNILLLQLTLLPGHWLTLLCSSPDLK